MVWVDGPAPTSWWETGKAVVDAWQGLGRVWVADEGEEEQQQWDHEEREREGETFCD